MTRLFDITAGKNHELLLALQSVGVTAEDADNIVKIPAAARAISEAVAPYRSYDRFKPYLRSIEQQLATLRELNAQLPPIRQVPEHWFAKVDTESQHEQAIDDLEFLFVAFYEANYTALYNRDLLEIAQRTAGGIFTAENLDERRAEYFLDRTGHRYSPGIHRLRINLVDNWSSRSVDAVRAEARKASRKLAGAEVLGAYALQDVAILRLMDGRNLPMCALAGISKRSEDGISVPRLNMIHGQSEVFIGSWGSYTSDKEYAAPTILTD